MTPEAAHEFGKRAAARLAGTMCAEGYCNSDVNESEVPDAELVEAVEVYVSHAADSRYSSVDMAHALRGAGAFWRGVADEIEARAAALEATR